MVIWQAQATFFSILELLIFIVKFLSKSASKSSSFRFGVEIWFLEQQFLPPYCRHVGLKFHCVKGGFV